MRSPLLKPTKTITRKPSIKEENIQFSNLFDAYREHFLPMTCACAIAYVLYTCVCMRACNQKCAEFTILLYCIFIFAAFYFIILFARLNLDILVSIQFNCCRVYYTSCMCIWSQCVLLSKWVCVRLTFCFYFLVAFCILCTYAYCMLYINIQQQQSIVYSPIAIVCIRYSPFINTHTNSEVNMKINSKQNWEK